jgi:Lecithin retinol acyltransferase
MNPDLQLAQAEFPLGGHLVSRRDGYCHHGIYVGGGKVIHYAGFCTTLHRGAVAEVTLEGFAAGHPVSVYADASVRYTGTEVVRRARSRLGENHYRLLTNNCEHFCTWCLAGVSRSEQVRVCFEHPAVAVRAIKGICSAVMAARSRQLGFAAPAVLAA